MIKEIVLAVTLSLSLTSAASTGAEEEAKSKLVGKLRKEIEKKVPSRGSTAVWCTASRCDAGVAGSFLRKESIFFRDRYWTLDAFLGKDSAGVGFTVEPFKRDLAGELRLFVGAAFVVELGSHDIEKLPGSAGLIVKATF